jgi:hypothetical protein
VDAERRHRFAGRAQFAVPALGSGDHLHPNDAGDLAMANVVPLDSL